MKENHNQCFIFYDLLLLDMKFEIYNYTLHKKININSDQLPPTFGIAMNVPAMDFTLTT